MLPTVDGEVGAVAVNAPANAMGPEAAAVGPANPAPPKANDPAKVLVFVPLTVQVFTVCRLIRPEPRVLELSNSMNLPLPVASIENA